MFDLSTSLQQELSQLPDATGILWQKSGVGFPIFAVTGCSFKFKNVQSLRPITHEYGAGQLLEFPLELTPSNGLNPTYVSLLVNASNDLYHLLLKAPFIEIWECDPLKKVCESKQLVPWPEMYRNHLSSISRQSLLQLEWSSTIKPWKAEKQVKIEKKSLDSKAAPKVINNKLPTTNSNKGSSDVSPTPVNFEQDIIDAAPFSLFYWQPGRHLSPAFMFKIPKALSTKSISVTFSLPDFRNYNPEGSVVLIPFSIVNKKASRVLIQQIYVFNPHSAIDRQVLMQLETAKQIDVYMYPEGTLYAKNARQKVKQFAWSASYRDAIKNILNTKIANSTTLWPQAKKRCLLEEKIFSEQKKIQEEKELLALKNIREHEQTILKIYPLPKRWRKQINASPQPSIMLLQDRESPEPCILIKTSANTKILRASIAFQIPGDNTTWKVPTFELKVSLSVGSGREETQKVFYYPVEDKDLISPLAKIHTVPIMLIASDRNNHIIACESILWPTEAISIYSGIQRTNPIRKELARLESLVMKQKNSAVVNNNSADLAIKKQQSVAPIENLYEQCLQMQQDNIAYNRVIGRPVNADNVGRIFLPAALGMAQKFILESQAIELISSKRWSFKERSLQYQCVSINFPLPHLWFELKQPIRSTVCPDTTALLVCSMDDEKLYLALKKKYAYNLALSKEIERARSHYRKSGQAIFVINSLGEIVWSMSLTANRSATQWPAPVLPLCPFNECQFVATGKNDNARNKYIPCIRCKPALEFYSSWLYTASYAFLGTYRVESEVRGTLDRIGREFIRPTLPIDGKPQKDMQVNQRYRIIRYIDISQHMTRYRDDTPLNPRGSWVEAYKAIDPSLVAYETQEVSTHIRRLKHPRYDNYVRTHGTNEIVVQAHERSQPKLANVERIIKVSAKRFH